MCRSVDPAAKRVLLADGAGLEYDSLSPRFTSNYYGNDAWPHWTPALKSVEEATIICHQIRYAFEVTERVPTRLCDATGSGSSSWEQAPPA
jgi:NADH dehydrogenase FAD-containing subunit